MILSIVLMASAGCIDYSEELHLNRDYSGTITMSFAIAEMYVGLSEDAGRTDNLFTEDGIRNRFADIEGVEYVSSDIRKEEDVRYISITLNFDSLEAFDRISNARSETDFLGEINVNETEDGNVLFTRTVTLSKEKVENSHMSDRLLNEFSWLYTIQFPGTIIRANTPDSNIDYDRHTVTWAYSMAVLGAGPERMVVVFTPPEAPNYLMMVIAGLIFVVVFGILYRALRHM